METVHGRSTKLNTIIYDAAVVGGGIAGASAVISLAQAGIGCVWLRPDFVDRGHRVGESLAPAANTILNSLGLSKILDSSVHRRSNATFSAWGKEFLVERNAAIHLEGAGHVVDRSQFEKDLFSLANESCSAFVEGELKSCHAETGIWKLITESQSAATIQSRFLIDATGRAQSIGRTLVQNNTHDHLVAAFSFLTQKGNSDVQATCATLIETVDTGWWYASLLPAGVLALNYYSDPDLMPKGLTNNLDDWKALIRKTKHISHWIDDAEFIINAPPKIASAATRCLSSAAGIQEAAPWAAIGDAAASFDPLSAHGMTTALWAATRVPDLVSGFKQGNDKPLFAYADAVAQGVNKFLSQRGDMYAQEKRFKESEFWLRRCR